MSGSCQNAPCEPCYNTGTSPAKCYCVRVNHRAQQAVGGSVGGTQPSSVCFVFFFSFRVSNLSLVQTLSEIPACKAKRADVKAWEERVESEILNRQKLQCPKNYNYYNTKTNIYRPQVLTFKIPINLFPVVVNHSNNFRYLNCEYDLTSQLDGRERLRRWWDVVVVSVQADQELDVLAFGLI